MSTRKLPPYPALKTQFLNGSSYSTLALKYDVVAETVYQSLKRGARKAGDPWPFPQDTSNKIKAGLRDSTVNTGMIRDLLREYLTSAYANETEFFVDTTHIQKYTVAVSFIKVHLDGCKYQPSGDRRVPITREAAALAGYGECQVCTVLSVRQFSQQTGLSQTYMDQLLRGRMEYTNKARAAEILRAIGETPHSDLVSWTSLRDRAWSRARRTKIAS